MWRLKFLSILRGVVERLRSVSTEDEVKDEMRWVRQAREQPVTTPAPDVTELYETSDEWWKAFLGPRLKYSASLFRAESMSLDEAETDTFEHYVQMGEFEDGQKILDLG